MTTSAESRVWLVTGVSSGIGAALAAACVAAGDPVAATSRDPGDLAPPWASAPDHVLPLRLDLTHPGEVARVVDAAVMLRARQADLARDLDEAAHLAVDTTFPDTGPLDHLSGSAVAGPVAV